MTARRPAQRCKDQLDMANGCLDMIHETIAGFGMDLSGTPPMFYPEAIQTLVSRAVEGVLAWRGVPLQDSERAAAFEVVKAACAGPPKELDHA
jgi:hypothetical protein